MATTQLSVTATPGKPHSFSPKAKAGVVAGPHTGLFTELSVMATPGARHSFSPKTAATPVSGPHSGLFTELSVMAVPGMRHTFSAKAAAEVAKVKDGGGSAGDREARARLRKRLHLLDEQDLMDVVKILMKSGILN